MDRTGGIAPTPEPPYTAVIFTSTPTDDRDGYAEAADEMEELAQQQPGFLGLESASGWPSISVSYWTSGDTARAWKSVAAHVTAQRIGRERWYRDYRVRVARVERDYGPTG